MIGKQPLAQPAREVDRIEPRDRGFGARAGHAGSRALGVHDRGPLVLAHLVFGDVEQPVAGRGVLQRAQDVLAMQIVLGMMSCRALFLVSAQWPPL
jgi:hypothetical protein